MSRMRFAVALAAVALALAAISAAGYTSLAAADSEQDAEYQSFRIPSHRWFNWTADVNASGRRTTRNMPGSAIREGLVSGGVSTTTSWFYDSDAFQRRLSLSVGAFMSRDHGGRSFVDSFTRVDDEATSNDAMERIALSTGVRIYPWAIPLGLDFSAFGDAQLVQNTNEQDFVRSEPPPVSRSEYREEVDLSQFVVATFATVGLGRVRDATVVYRTQLLEQRLRANGNLRRALSSDTRRKVAALFYTEYAFSVPHDRPAKYFWREIESILREDGALESGSLDAYALFRVLEPAIEGRPLARNVGFFIGPSVMVNDQQAHRRSTRRIHNVATLGDTVLYEDRSVVEETFYDHQAFAGVGGRAEYHRPLGMRWQVDANSSFQYVDRFDLMRIGSRGTVSYLLADRWFADASVTHLWDRTNAWSPQQHDIWRLGYSGTIAYFLEDAWRLGLTWNADEFHETANTTRNAQFQLGLTYHIAGRLDVPGVVEPVRMLRR